jgi:hypothetical protein
VGRKGVPPLSGQMWPIRGQPATDIARSGAACPSGEIPTQLFSLDRVASEPACQVVIASAEHPFIASAT